jgi:site-specific recombinase XerD
MVQIIRKTALPQPSDVAAHLRLAAEQALAMGLREPRPVGFPLLFSGKMRLIEPAVAFLHEHSIQRAHTEDTLRTYNEILYDWFETLEQSCIDWAEADAVDLVAYRNRMMQQPSAHTGRPYRVSTINHRVRGVLRFYEWAVRMRWLAASPLATCPATFAIAQHPKPRSANAVQAADNSLFILRQFEPLPRPLSSAQAREILARLAPPYDLMARWQIYTGLRVSELIRLTVKSVCGVQPSVDAHRTIDVMRKGRKLGYVIAPASLLDESTAYHGSYRQAWLLRAGRRGRLASHATFFINSRGTPVVKNTYQTAISRAGEACGFKATTHLLRATYACMLLARLERLASSGSAVNPLLVVKVLMGHERIETTDRYLRAIAVDSNVLKEVLDTLLSDGS